jgi:SAM-dependent methyltransferase
MHNFEKNYYENNNFWEGTIEDEGNRIRIARTVEMVPAECNTLLDAGCGNGVFGRHLRQSRPLLKWIVNMDRSFSALNFVDGEKVQGSLDAIPFADSSFDCVTCLEVIEHLPLPVFETTLQELCRVTRQFLIISVPYAEQIEKNVTQCPSCFTIFNADLHLQKFSMHRMKNLLDNFGFKNIAIETLVTTETYVGRELYGKVREWIKNPSPALSFRSPICPLCGFANLEFHGPMQDTFSTKDEPSSRVKKPTVIEKLKSVPKMFWPKKELPGYWILGLYERTITPPLNDDYNN